MLRRSLLTRTGTWLAATSLPARLRAQSTSRIVVGFAAGGPGDILARFVAEQLKKLLGDSIIVENRPGAAGRIAINFVKSAEPDGATMLNTPASLLTLLPHALKSGDYNPLQELTPVATLSDLEFALVINAKLPAKTLGEYLQLCKTDPLAASYGTAGAGTPQHMLGALLGKVSGVALTHVAYRGGGPALQDVIGGAAPASIGTLSDLMLSSRNEGRIRILATSGSKRSAFLQDVPTMVEAGMKEVVATDCSGILVPVKTPQAAVARLSKALLDVVSSPEFKVGLNRFFMEPLALDQKAYGEKLRNEYEAWRPIVKATGFTLDT